jgi:hypothetical protein
MTPPIGTVGQHGETNALGIRNEGGNDGAGEHSTGRFPQVSAAMTEGDGSNRIQIFPEL